MITLATVLLVVAAAAFVVRVLLGPSLADRVVALDGLVVTLTATILVHSVRLEDDSFVDVAVVVAFVGFLGAVAGARFIERRGG